MTSAAWDRVLREVRAQISAAVAGQTLTSTAGAGTTNWFWSPPTDVAAANALVAYWLAVGARLGYPGLVAPAQRFYAAAAGAWTTFASTAATDIAGIIDQGVVALDSVGAYKDRRFAGIYRAFGQQRRADQIAATQALDYQRSTQAIVAGTVKGTAADIAKIAESAGRVITDKKPSGTPDWLWWLQRNAWFVVGGTVAVGALYLFLKPVLAPAVGVRDAAAAAARRAAGKATARLSTVASNPRRRRRLRSR